MFALQDFGLVIMHRLDLSSYIDLKRRQVGDDFEIQFVVPIKGKVYFIKRHCRRVSLIIGLNRLNQDILE